MLSDPDTRRRYDAYGSEFRHVPEGADQRSRGRARAGARTGGGGDEDVWFSTDGADVDIEDLLGGMFGGSAWLGSDPRRRSGGRSSSCRWRTLTGAGLRTLTLAGAGGTHTTM